MSTEQKLTHYKKLINPDYLGAYSLEAGKDMVLTIKSVAKENVKGHGGKVEELTVARFKEIKKPMVLNVTNCKTIKDIYSTPYIEEWEGKKIQVYGTEVKFGGEMVEALRIRPIIPKTELPELTPNHEKWEIAKKNMKDGNTTVQAIKKHYELSPKNEKLLCS